MILQSVRTYYILGLGVVQMHIPGQLPAKYAIELSVRVKCNHCHASGQDVAEGGLQWLLNRNKEREICRVHSPRDMVASC